MKRILSIVLMSILMPVHFQIYASPGIRTLVTASVVGAGNFVDGIATQALHAIGILPQAVPQTLPDLITSSGESAGLAAILVAPVFVGWHIGEKVWSHEERLDWYQGYYERVLCSSLQSISCQTVNKSSYDYQNILYARWASNRFKALYQRPADASHEVSEHLACAPIFVMPFGCLLSLACDCPELAATAYAVSCASVGAAFLKEKKQSIKFEQMKNQVDRDFTEKKHETDEQHLDNVDTLVTDVIKKKKEIYDNNSLYKQDEINQMIRSVIDKK